MVFPKNFLWGAASSAYQIEGAYQADDKTPSIWDALSKGHIKRNENGDIACDHFHRFKEDIALMKKMGLKSYRFSISWPRIMPTPDTISEAGLRFYDELINELIRADIEPLCTLYHWDLPLWMYEKGGWETEEIIHWFTKFASIVTSRFSDRVTYWMTINEPTTFIGNGYSAGVHAPFLKKSESELKEISRIVMLAHGSAVMEMRKVAPRPIKIGFALTGGVVTPLSEEKEDLQLAKDLTFSDIMGIYSNVWWHDPLILGTVPDILQGYLTEEDLHMIHQPLDFLGFNTYCAWDYEDFIPQQYDRKPYPGMPRMTTGWPITPNALYWSSKFFYERYKMPLIISENGLANLDFEMSDGQVHDSQRVDFLKTYLTGLKKAVSENIPVIGYQYWSVMDNFEWADGYEQRFGLIYVDFMTQKRILKDSGLFYKEIIESNGEDL